MYKFESRVRYSEADERELLSTIGIINYFQDCSTFQSEDLGLGLSYLHEHHIAWLVNFWQIEIRRYPRVGERIRVGTSPYDFKGFMGYRNFLLETTEGEELAIANSVWSLMNMETMRPERLSEVMKVRYARNPRMDMEYAPRKIALPEGEDVLRTGATPVVIGEHHLDSNHHVNNAEYVGLALSAVSSYLNSVYKNESFSGDVADNSSEKISADRDAEVSLSRVSEMRVEYKLQSVLGDVIYPFVSVKDDNIYVVLRNADGNPKLIAELTIR